MRRLLSLVLLPFLGTAGQTSAHPHVFVDVDVGFHIIGSHLSSLHIVWTYDEFTTLNLISWTYNEFTASTLFDILDAEPDGNGDLNQDDLAKIAAGETDWPPGYNGDVYLESGHRPVELAKPTNASAEMHDDRIAVRFDLPLNEPLDLSMGAAIVRLYDPTYYYAHTVTGVTNPIPGAGPCQATIAAFEADAAAAALQEQLAALSRDEMPEQANVGRLFADTIVLTCS